MATGFSGLLSDVLRPVLGTGFLPDPSSEAPLGVSDRVTSFGAGSSVLVDQSSVVPQVTPGQLTMNPVVPSTNEPPTVSTALTDHFFRLAVCQWKPTHRSIHQGRRMELLMRLPIPQAFMQLDPDNPMAGTSNPLFAPVALLQYYRFLRAGFEFVLQVNALPFSEGQLLMWFEPVYEEGFLDADDLKTDFTHWKSLFSVFNFPHGFLNLFVNSSVRLSVPFTYFENAFDLIMRTNRVTGVPLNRVLGFLKVAVLNPLRTHENIDANAVDVTLLGRFSDLKLWGLRPLHTLPYYVVKAANEGRDPPVRAMNDGVNIQPGAGAMHMSNVEHTSRTHTLSLSPYAALPDISSFGFRPTADLLEFAKIPSLVMWTQWTDLAMPGTLLFELPVTPRLEFYQYPDFSTDLKVSNETFTGNLSALSHLYSSWRGSISFKFQVVMSNFHRGRFGVFFVPGATFRDALPTLAQLQSSRFSLFDLGVESTFTFTVPYLDSRPYVNTTTYGWCQDEDPNDDGAQGSRESKFHVQDGAVFFHDSYTLDNCTGMLYVMVVNQLQATETVAHAIDMNVYTLAGADFEFLFPVETDFSLTVSKPHAEDATAQVDTTTTPVETTDPTIPPGVGDLAGPVLGTVGSIEDAQTGQMPQTSDPTVILVPDFTFAYSHTELRNVLGRAHYYTTRSFTVSTAGVQKVYMMRLMMPELGTCGAVFSMHTFWRGPITLHITPNAAIPGRAVFLVAVLPQGSACPLTITSILAAGAVSWDTASSQNLTVEVPYYVNTNGLLCKREYLDMNHSSPRAPIVLGHLVIMPLKFDSGRFSFQLAISFHREFVLVLKRATPIMRVYLTYNNNTCFELDTTRQVVQNRRGALDPFTVFGSEPWTIRVAEATGKDIKKTKKLTPLTKDAWLVKKKRPLYDHYGVSVGDNSTVVCLDSDGADMVAALVKGKARVVSVPIDGWEFVSEASSEFADEHACALVGEDMKYDLLRQNCEHVSRFITHGENRSDQVVALRKFGIGAACASAGAAAIGVIAGICKDGISLLGLPSKEEVTETMKSVREACETVKSFQTQIPDFNAHVESLRTAFPDVGRGIIAKLAGLLVKIVGYGAMLAVNHNLSTLLGVLTCIGGDVLMEVGTATFMKAVHKVLDCISCGQDATSPLSDAAAEIAAAMTGSDPISKEGKLDCMRDFNTVTQCWRNVEWVFDRFLALINRFISWLVKTFGFNLKCFGARDESITNWLADVECMRAEMAEEGFKADSQFVLRLKKINLFADALVRLPGTWKRDEQISAAVRWAFVQAKIAWSSLNDVTDPTRSEPVVIMVSGAPGQGKSLLASYLAADLCAIHGCNPQEDVYNKPPGAEFFDGYHGQLVHIIDDIGQDPDDEDWSDFTMLVSTTVFRPNMASLEDKGVVYSSRYVILTTNFPEISPVSVRSYEAVRRRVWLHVDVKAKGDYLVGGCLSLGKALADSVAADLSCCDISRLEWKGNTTKPCGSMTLMEIALSAHAEWTRRSDILKRGNVERSTFQQTAYSLPPRVEKHGNTELPLAVCNGGPVSQADAVKWFKKYDSSYVQISCSDEVKYPRSDSLCNPFLSGGAYEKPINEKWRAIRDSVLSLVRKICVIPTWYKAALVASSVMAMIGLGSSIALHRKLDKLTEDKKKDEEKQGPYTGPPSTVTVKPGVKLDLRIRKDSENYEGLVKMSRSICMLRYVLPDGQCSEMRGLFIGCDVLLFPSHLFDKGPDGVLVVKYADDDVEVEVRNRKVMGMKRICVGDGATDLVAVYIPGMRHHAPKISNLFATMSDFSNLPRRGCMVTLREEGVFCMQISDIGLCGEVVAEGDVMTPCGIKYTGTSARGFCGQPIMGAFAVGYRCIGIHVASCTGLVCFSIPVDKRTIEELISLCAPVKNFAPGVEVVKTLERPVYVPSNTSIFPTNICDSIRAPACMSSQAVLPSFAKYDREWSTEVPCAEVTAALIARLRGELGDLGPLLTYEQAIYGDGRGLAPLDHNSSPGYPYLLYNMKKSDLYLDPTFQSSVIEVLDGDRDVVFTTFFKDELRPIDKVLAKKTRLIDAAPVDYTVAFRMAYGHFLSAMHREYGLSTHHMIGCNPDNDWTVLYWGLREFGARTFMLDYSAFDSSVSKDMLLWVSGVISAVSGVTRAPLFQALIDGKRIFKRDVYAVGGGLPSGTPCTSILDSIVNMGVIYQSIWDANRGFDFSKLDKFCRFVTYGDDILLCARSNEEGWSYSFDDIVETTRRFGMKVTSVAKNDSCLGEVDLDDASFLKRGFRREPNSILIHPVIDIDTTITDLLAWKRKGAKFSDNANCALMFAYHHGRDVYERVKALALSKCKEGDLMTFEFLDYLWKSAFHN